MGRTTGRGPDDTKQLILDAAKAVVISHGAKATLDDVAAAAGLSRGAVIYHYSSKNALWTALAEHVLFQFRTLVHDRLEEGDTPGRLARAFIAASLDGDLIEEVGERLFLLASLAIAPGVKEIVAADNTAWKTALANDGLHVGAQAVISSSVDGAGLAAGWGLAPSKKELRALRGELERLATPEP
ncbi:TetR/AcrR family transcriptional regulator [Microbacterium sp. PF5]|uniref:TetR/AcrR family transcriptional regulator n=1 Tax=Microbacterium sp. PF5 TaxID=2305435 RepID=UPI00109BEDF3|nr:TetR family transcriptional regulator [Microbacterium sp. PF5]